MITGKQFRQILDKFIESPAGQHARVQVQLPNGEFLDISELRIENSSSAYVESKVKHAINRKKEY